MFQFVDHSLSKIANHHITNQIPAERNQPPLARLLPSAQSPTRANGAHMTDQQLEANRANAQLSTGPKTPEGKRRASLNSYRHGLSGQIHIATPEETAVFPQTLRCRPQ